MQQVAEQLATFQLDDEALKLWNSYTFPGNVRELRNIIIRLSSKYPGQTVKSEVLKREMSGLQGTNGATTGEGWLNEALQDADFELDRLLKMVEKKAIDLAMREHQGNVSKAAEMLGINRTTLYGRMDRLEGRE
jgi:two-component system nitrogen regulation response regulator GlnG